MRYGPILAGVAGVSLAASVLAGGTITSGNASLQFIGNPIFSAPGGDANLLCDPTASGGYDTLSKFTWYYRTVADNQNRLFSSLNNPVETYIGNRANVAYSAAGAGTSTPPTIARFDAGLQVTLTDLPGANQSIIEQRLVVVSNASNAASQTYQFFFFFDPTLGIIGANPFSNDGATCTSTNAALTRVRFSDGTSSEFIDTTASNASRYEIGTSSSILSKLGAGSQDMATSAGTIAGAVSNIDAAAGYQWTVTLAPGQSKILAVKIGVNTLGCPADFNNSGNVTVQDLLDFFTQWLLSNPSADANLDGSVSVQDILDFISGWLAGC